MTDNFTMTVQDYNDLRQKGTDHVLLDIREASERDICKISDDIHIPMGDLSARYQELDDEALIVVYCHHGIRSAQVARFLQTLGFENVRNLQGGIASWALDIDQEMAQY